MRRCTQRYCAGVLSLLIGSLVTGCGGGHSMAGSAPAATLRSARTGDTWNWNITGTYRTADGTTTPFTATAQAVVNDQFIQRNWYKQVVYTVNNASAPLPFSLSSSQDYVLDTATGDQLFVADRTADGKLRFTVQPYVDLPGTWSSAVTLSQNRTFQNGDTETYLFRVIDHPTLQTAIGTYVTWECEEKTETTTTTIDRTTWYALPLGPLPVKETTVIQDKRTGSTINLECSVSSTNLARQD